MTKFWYTFESYGEQSRDPSDDDEWDRGDTDTTG